MSGTPDPGTGGTYNVTFTATNGVGANATQAFTLTVNQAPAITSANTATFVLNTAGTTFQVVMTGFPAPTVSVTSGVLPTGLTLSAAGVLSGTPTQSGSFPVTLTATNGTLPNATQAFTVAGQRAAGDHQREQHHLHRRHAGHLHGDDDRLPGADRLGDAARCRPACTFTPATRVLGGTRDADGRVPAGVHRDQRHHPGRRAELHVERRLPGDHRDSGGPACTDGLFGRELPGDVHAERRQHE